MKVWIRYRENVTTVEWADRQASETTSPGTASPIYGADLKRKAAETLRQLGYRVSDPPAPIKLTLPNITCCGDADALADYCLSNRDIDPKIELDSNFFNVLGQAEILIVDGEPAYSYTPTPTTTTPLMTGVTPTSYSRTLPTAEDIEERERRVNADECRRVCPFLSCGLWGAFLLPMLCAPLIWGCVGYSQNAMQVTATDCTVVNVVVESGIHCGTEADICTYGTWTWTLTLPNSPVSVNVTETEESTLTQSILAAVARCPLGYHSSKCYVREVKGKWTVTRLDQKTKYMWLMIAGIIVASLAVVFNPVMIHVLIKLRRDGMGLQEATASACRAICPASDGNNCTA